MIIKTLTRIDDTFEDLFKQVPQHHVDSMRTTGTLIFEPSQVCETTHKHDRILRGFLVQNRVTVEYFGERFRSWAMISRGVFHTEVNTQKNNLLKALRKGYITFNKFEEALEVLGYHIKDTAYEISDESGNVETYKYSDATNGKEQ